MPGSTDTGVTGINNAGQIVGSFKDPSGREHGFIDTNGTFTTIDVPGKGFTEVNDINNLGGLVGLTVAATGTNTFRGFVESHGVFTIIEVLMVTLISDNAVGMNDAGQIVGEVFDSTGTHGFLATQAPEPASLLLVAAGLGFYCLRKKRIPTVA